jgi:putative redox protein
MVTPNAPQEAVVAEATGEGLFQVRIDTGDHSFLMDEPVAYGGLASGPNPFDLLSAALAGCTLMTLKLYAQRKGWALDQLNVRVTHQKGSADTRDRFDPIVELGDVTDEQRAALLKIAQRCPVHLLLERGADVTASEALAELPGAVANGLHAQEVDEACREDGTR